MYLLFAKYLHWQLPPGMLGDKGWVFSKIADSNVCKERANQENGFRKIRNTLICVYLADPILNYFVLEN